MKMSGLAIAKTLREHAQPVQANVQTSTTFGRLGAFQFGWLASLLGAPAQTPATKSHLSKPNVPATAMLPQRRSFWSLFR